MGYFLLFIVQKCRIWGNKSGQIINQRAEMCLKCAQMITKVTSDTCRALQFQRHNKEKEKEKEKSTHIKIK